MANYNPTTPSTGAVADAAKNLGNTVADEAKGVTGALGSRLERAGDYLEEKGKAAFISDRLHSAGRYLQENDVRSITRSVDEAICAHPYRSMLFGLGMGWVIGKFLSK